MRSAALLAVVIVAGGAVLAAQRASQPAGRRGAAAGKVSTAATCKQDLGKGVSSGRRFCDVVIAVTPDESIMLKIPDHTGPATLIFDLHNRFRVPTVLTPRAQAFARHTALVGVVRPKGELIDRAVITSEFRTPTDLFDRLTGEGPGGVKGDAPGRRIEAVRITVPAGVTAVGLVGLRLDVLTAGGSDSFDNPGRPIAIASNLRVEYIPR